MKIKVTQNQNKVIVESPYNYQFVKAARAAGGQWDKAARVWVFEDEGIDIIRDLVRRHYGMTGDEATETVVVSPPDNVYNDNKVKLPLIDRPVLVRSGRDAPVEPGKGVVILEGKFPSSGGSKKYPKINQPTSRVVLKIKDVPTHVVAAMRDEGWEFVTPGEHNNTLAEIARILGCEADPDAICAAVKRLA